MNFNEAMQSVELVLMSGEVPLLIGESGIGKTSLVKAISKKNNYFLINIDANLLKEGEIGGLPVVEDIYDIKGNKKKVTRYAIHNKLLEIDEAISKGYEKVLLFIDELNRCEHAVQQELMNIILNREINGYKLDENVNIISAMNPSNKYDNYEQSDYNVVDMDSAQEDRFVWIEVSSDIKSWLKWAMKENNIHEDIIEFLSSFPEYLHNIENVEFIKSTPRSWERVSKSYKVFSENKEKFSYDIFYNVVKGNVGVNIAQDFMSYIKNIKSPILKPTDIFKDDILNFEMKEKLSSENHSRLYIIAKSCINYLESLELINNEINIFCSVLSSYPKDLRLGIMKDIKSDCRKDIYEKFLDNDNFLEVFFDIYS